MSWKTNHKLFFDDRAATIDGPPTDIDLCYVSGKEPRLWSDPLLYSDMIDSICARLLLDQSSSVLEVGCAAGFVAKGLAPRVRSYVGVDVSASSIRVASRLDLRNAAFRVADGEQLEFNDASFDGVVCYDVFINIPTAVDGSRLVAELIRVVKPGGRVLLGSIPDAATKPRYEQVVKATLGRLEREKGPVERRFSQESVGQTAWFKRWLRRLTGARPGVAGFYFDRTAFVSLGAALEVDTSVEEIHARNPYRGMRFDVVYTRRPG